MDSDFGPGKRSAKSLRTALDVRRSAGTPTPDSINETFRTPEEVAAVDNSHLKAVMDHHLERLDMGNGADTPPTLPKAPKGPGGWRNKLRLSWPPGRKEWLTSAVIILVCGSIVGFVLTHTGDKPIGSATPVAKKAPAKPTTVPSTLTGLQVDPSINARPVTGVMIENSLDSRPQSGLSEAGVVFEAIAEGGITRFLALYQDTAPAEVGPVRSARPYYIQWLLGFDANYAHVGGSPEALANIRALGVKDLDQFANAGAYRRVSQRVAPHNVYTTIETLNQVGASKGYTTSTYKGFVRKAPPKPAAKPKTTPKTTAPAPPPANSAKAIDLRISSPNFNVHYDYNAATNTYNRSLGGAPHVDVNGNRHISPAVVVAMVVPFGIHSDGKHSVYGVIGSGPVSIFQDGVVTTGTWTKPADREQITFATADGKPLGLNPGQTWVTAVADPGRITFSP